MPPGKSEQSGHALGREGSQPQLMAPCGYLSWSSQPWGTGSLAKHVCTFLWWGCQATGREARGEKHGRGVSNPSPSQSFQPRRLLTHTYYRNLGPEAIDHMPSNSQSPSDGFAISLKTKAASLLRGKLRLATRNFCFSKALVFWLCEFYHE